MGLVHNIVGIIGNVISFGLFLSPVPTFYQIYKKKAVEEFQPYPYLGTVMNCLIWMFYGLPIVKNDNILVLTINSVGLAIELIYLSVYAVYANDRKKRVLDGSDVFNIIMYGLPLAIWKKVFDTKSVEYMPFWLSLAGFSNGICWTIYALIQFDIFILVSNGLGSILGAIQLGLYAYFYFNGNDKAKDQVKKPSELQLSDQPRGTV
ncbi:methyl-CpG-binding domain-containing protein 9-like isoform X1 [Hibiscus syriacus]|uniref:Methyl-CpG-binding domain-containing protein 9-like isoform X1 n=1 Tax=Hibiscus syriacus TaxID=106335 RepID=A0A6A3D2M4_HIBSY|nr:methyl-CpG-binding domain-containing protein 9-like isoform X1 [Hibiscus syriacus]